MCFSKQKLAWVITELMVILELTSIPIQGKKSHMELCCSPAPTLCSNSSWIESPFCGTTAPVPHQAGEQEAASKSEKMELRYSAHSTHSSAQKSSWKQTRNRWQVYAESREVVPGSKAYCCPPCFLPTVLPSFDNGHGEKWIPSICWQTGMEHAPSCLYLMYPDGMNESLVMTALGLIIHRA